MEGIEDRIAGATTLLRASRGTPEFARVSQLQAECISAQCDGVVLSADNVAKLADLICEVPWASSEHRKHALTAVSQRNGPSRAKLQDYEGILKFIPDRIWGILRAPESDLITKLGVLVDYSIALGLRNPSEPTFATMTSLLLVCDQGSEAAQALPPQQVRDLFSHLKKEFRKRALKANVVECIPALPENVASFAEKFPLTFQRAVGPRGSFAKAPFSALDVIAVRNKVSMRQRGGAAQSLQPAAAATAAVNNPAAMLSAMLAFAQHFAPQFQPQVAADPIDLRILGGAPSLAIANSPLVRFGSNSSLDASPARLGRLALGPPSTTTARTTTATATTAALPWSEEGRGTTRQGDTDGEGDTDGKDDGDDDKDDEDEGDAEGDEQPQRKAPRLSVDEAAAKIMDSMKAREVLKRPAAAGAGKSKAGAGESKPPSWTNERSRSQILYRSGNKGSGQSRVFKYTDKKTMAAAIKQASDLVKAELARRG